MTTTHADTASRTAEQIARRLFDLLNRRDLDGVAELQHPDIYEDFLVLRPLSGRAEVRKFFEGLMTAFPDFQLEIEKLTCEGDTVVVQWVSRGTFSGGSFEGIEPNGKRVVVRGVDVMRCEAGLLRHNTVYYDGMSFARQVGLLPEQGSAAEKAMTAAFNLTTRARKLLGG
jgi:steroid delta-isomerase-like uncharacterized protein